MLLGRRDTSSILRGRNEREGYSCKDIYRSGEQKFCVLPLDDFFLFFSQGSRNQGAFAETEKAREKPEVR